MGIRKKFFLITASAMLTVLVCSYLMLYYFLYHTMYDETVTRQRATVELNRQMANNFVQSVYHTAIQVVSDQTLGKALSVGGDDPMVYISNSQNIRTLFSHYSTHQVIDSTYYYRNTLFLSDQIPISAYFEPHSLDTNPYSASNMVFSNQAVKDQEWYQKTLSQITHVFLNRDTSELCLARKLNNTYYEGPYLPGGTAVMVVSVALDQLENVFASVPITEHGGYALLNQAGEILFCSRDDIPLDTFRQAFSLYETNKKPEFEAPVGGSKYIISHCHAEYGIQLLFMTPTQDITSSLTILMRNYSLLFLGIILVTLVVIYFLMGRLTHPLIHLSKTISGIRDTRLFDTAQLHVSKERELRALQDSFEKMLNNTNQLIEDIQIQGEKQKRSQLQALQAQINPHFIFNTMDMVNWLALSRDCDDIAGIVSSIANLMRYSITNSDGMVTITEELANIREFITIFQLRHHNSLQLENLVADDMILIPKFTLQPLVENSIRHAVPREGENLIITITGHSSAGEAVIEVTDNGTTSDAKQLNQHLNYEKNQLKVSSGFGIRNVNERIHLWFANHSGLTYYNTPDGGLTARIVLDYNQQKGTIQS